MKPYDAAMMCFNSLSDKEKAKMAEAIGAVARDTRSKCERDGHRYKKMVQREPALAGLIPGYVLLVCECCGDPIRTKFGV